MTPEQKQRIDQIKRRLPWHRDKWQKINCGYSIQILTDNQYRTMPATSDDTDFIFNAPKDIEYLIGQLSEAQVLVDRLLDCQEAHLREIDNLNTAQQSAEQRASKAQAERGAQTQIISELMESIADLRKEKNQQISEHKKARRGFAQRASEAEQRAEHFKSERDALQAELSSLKADMFVLNNDMGYTTGVLEDVLKQRDELSASFQIVTCAAKLAQMQADPETFEHNVYTELVDFLLKAVDPNFYSDELAAILKENNELKAQVRFSNFWNEITDDQAFDKARDKYKEILYGIRFINGTGLINDNLADSPSFYDVSMKAAIIFDSGVRMVDYSLKQRDALQAECSALRRGHDKTHQSIDRAIAQLSLKYNDQLFSEHYILRLKTEDIKRAIEILTGEGEA